MASAAPFDVAVIGGGFAGIAIANRVAGAGYRVALLEAGGAEYSSESQRLYEGEVVGRQYFPLNATRLRGLGGSSGHWAGWCRGLDDHDFDDLGTHEYAGWPISKRDLDAYSHDVETLLDLRPATADTELFYRDGSAAGLRQVHFAFSRPPTRMVNKITSASEVGDALTVFVNSAVVGIRLADDSARVESVRVRGIKTESPIDVRARAFVVACGGLENPRVLLLMQRQNPRHEECQNDHVGRFFMEHPEVRVGKYVMTQPTGNHGKSRLIFAPTRSFIQERRILNSSVRMYPVDNTDGDGNWRYHVKRAVCSAEWSANLFERTGRRCPEELNTGLLRVAGEQAPTPESRITLSDSLDSFGLPKLRLDWRLSEIDRRTMRETVLELGRYLADHDIARVQVASWLLEDGEFVPGLGDGESTGGHHHMGTSRMALNRESGVVDSDCRYFGLDNLYVAGSSVFPTGGFVNPTYSMLQLAFRLGDHLVGELSDQ